MVVFSCISVPVKAAVNVYRPSDYIKSIEYSGNNEIVYYWFDTTPYFSLKENSTNLTYSGYDNISINGVRSDETYVFRVWPLGTGFVPGQSASGGVIDIQDFKKKSVFHLSCVLNLEAQYAYQPMAQGDTTFHFISYPYVCFYRSDGSFVSQLSLSSVQTDITIEDYGNYEDSDCAYALDLTIPLQIPEGAVYMAPCFITYFYPPDSHSPHSIGSMEVSCREFVMRADKNLLLEQSETLTAVKDFLSGITGKLDTLINGTPEMDEALQDAQQGVQDFKEQMEALESQQNNTIQDFDEFCDVTWDTIKEMVEGAGWVALGDLVAPVMNWRYTGVILLLVVAFINMSVIFFGR